jgi:hypothetical protein
MKEIMSDLCPSTIVITGSSPLVVRYSEHPIKVPVRGCGKHFNCAQKTYITCGASFLSLSLSTNKNDIRRQSRRIITLLCPPR